MFTLAIHWSKSRRWLKLLHLRHSHAKLIRKTVTYTFRYEKFKFVWCFDIYLPAIRKNTEIWERIRVKKECNTRVCPFATTFSAGMCVNVQRSGCKHNNIAPNNTTFASGQFSFFAGFECGTVCSEYAMEIVWICRHSLFSLTLDCQRYCYCCCCCCKFRSYFVTDTVTAAMPKRALFHQPDVDTRMHFKFIHFMNTVAISFACA